jgi:cytochrome oxidase Cu insertion factor (SCO1/SenC/PrrC family)
MIPLVVKFPLIFDSMKRNKTLFQRASFCLLFTIQSCTSTDKNDSTATAQNDLPTMAVTKSDGTQLDLRGLTGKTVLILFQTECDHCQREATAIQENISAFKDYSLYFITTNPLQEIEKFANEYKLAGQPNVHFCQATSINILNSFGPIDAPSLYIYSNEKTLIKKFNGETSINEILKFL